MDEKDFKKRLRWSTGMFCGSVSLAYVLMVLSFRNFNEEEVKNFVNCAGVMLLGTGIAMNMLLSKAELFITPPGFTSLELVQLEEIYGDYLKWLAEAAVFITFIGTIISGFSTFIGDCLVDLSIYLY